MILDFICIYCLIFIGILPVMRSVVLSLMGCVGGFILSIYQEKYDTRDVIMHNSFLVLYFTNHVNECWEKTLDLCGINTD